MEAVMKIAVTRFCGVFGVAFSAALCLRSRRRLIGTDAAMIGLRPPPPGNRRVSHI